MTTMKVIDNVQSIVRDDLVQTITKGSRLSIAAACFSMYAYQELKKQLEGIEELRFIFTSDAFTTERAPKEKREFYIPRLDRERSLYGSEYELRLRNELSQKAVARECAAWIRKKVRFRSNTSGENMNRFMVVQSGEAVHTYQPLNGFTTVDMGCSRGNNASNIVLKIDSDATDTFLKTFDAIWSDPERLQDVTDVIIDCITAAYRDNAPEFMYFIALYNIFHEFLEDISEDVLPKEATGFKGSAIWNMLYHFQKDAALAIINKLEKFNGCILADSVGLGKTFTALAVIKYYESRNRTVLVLCPKKLSSNWTTYRDNYINNPIAADRLNYDVLYHTDLSRDRGESCGLDLSRLNWGNYDLVVIDESHNFRNGVGTHRGTRENRYDRLMERVIRSGVKTKVLMLSATPVNNRFYDLRNQLALAYEGHSAPLDDMLNTTKSIDAVFHQAQRAYTAWSKLAPAERTTERLLRMLDFDFFEVLDSVTIARSRRHIQRFYDTSEIGVFPQRRKPLSLRPSLTDLSDAINYAQIYEVLISLNLRIYTPTDFIQPSKLSRYVDTHEALNQHGREQGIRRLMSINLLKRLESSVYSFRVTLDRILSYITSTMDIIDRHTTGASELFQGIDIDAPEDWDDDDQNDDLLSVGKTVRIDLNDMDYVS